MYFFTVFDFSGLSGEDYDVTDNSFQNYQNVSLRMRFTLDAHRVMAARRRSMRSYDFRYDEESGVDRRRNLSIEEFRNVYDGKWYVTWSLARI